MKWNLRYSFYAFTVVIAIVLLVWLVRAATQTKVAIEVDDRINVTPEQIESIKAIGEWEFLSISDEELIDTVRKGFFSDDHLVRIYYGTVRLGINMHQVKPGWLKPSESGRWNPTDRESLYRRAYQKMLQRCLTPENIRNAQQNGEQQFRQMMNTMGFEHILIKWE